MVHTTEHSDGGSLDLEFWRQRLIEFRIDPSQLSYANKGKIVASGGYGCVRRAILLPQISKTDDNPEAHGRTAITSETAVAVKSLQAHGDIDLERFEKRFIREAYIWSQLKHTNILEFLGFHFLHSEGEVEALLVCPWFDNGQSIGYIKRHRPSPMQRLRLILDAAEGLYYLHSRDPPICHGDVKGSNLLIKDNGRGALCDFGSAHELDEMFQDIASKTTQRCTVRWASPERLDSNDPPTPSSDVWSWGWLTWEIMTEKVPFPLLTNVSAVIFHIITSKVPSCEKETGFMEFPHLSRFIQRCWQSTPNSRPTIFDAISKLKHLLEPNQSGADFIQAGGAPSVEASLSDHTQRQPQSLLDQNNKTTPERASPQSQTSIEVSNMSNPPVWTPEVDNKLPGYLPHPLYGDYFPLLFPPDISPFLSTGHPLETLSPTVDPEVPRPVNVDHQSKARVSSPRPVSGGTNGEPSETPDLSSHSGSGPSRLVMSKSPEILAEIPGSGSLAPRKRPFQSLETDPEVGPTLPLRKKRNIASMKMESLPGELPNEQLQKAASGESRRASPAKIIRRGRSLAKNLPSLPRSNSDTSGPLEISPLFQTPVFAQAASSQLQQQSITRGPSKRLDSLRHSLGKRTTEDEVADPRAKSLITQHRSSTAVADTSQRLTNPPQHEWVHPSASQQADFVAPFWHYESQPFISYPGSRSTDLQYSGFQQHSLEDYNHDVDMSFTTYRPTISVADVELFGNSLEDPKSTTVKGTLKATEQLVAVKSLLSVAARKPEESTLYPSELGEWISRCSSLEHPRTAEILGYTLTDDNLTIISVWYPNRNVADFLTVAPHVQRKPILIQIAEGLTYLHNHVPPIIHSNLKPGNILIDNEGNVKLADIGILRLVEANATQPEVQGKPEDIRWTAPEVLEGRPRSKSSDVYAFGCVALTILKDLQPYSSLQSDVAVAKAVARGEMPVTERQNSELHAVWRTCLAREEFRRPEMQEVQLSVGSW